MCDMKSIPSEKPVLLDYQSLMAVMPAPVIVIDVDDPVFTILEVNKAHSGMTLLPRNKVLNRPFFDVFPDTSSKFQKSGVSVLQETIRKVIRTKKTSVIDVFRYDIRSSDGQLTERYWQPTHVPVLSESGKVMAVLQVSQDVTSSVKIQNELQQARSQLDEARAIGSVGTWAWDVREDRVIGDKGLSQMFGVSEAYASRGLPLQVFIDTIHEHDRERVVADISATVDEGGDYEAEYRTVSKKGTVRWVLARGRADKDTNGDTVAFNGLIVDITARKNAEEELKESVRAFQTLADAMPQLIWVTKADGHHEYYNQAWYDYTGTKPGDTDGDGWNRMLHPDDQEKAWKVWQHSLKSGEPYSIEYRLLHAKTGEYRWFVGRALPTRDESGDIQKWYGTCTEIHEQKRAADTQRFLSDTTKILSTTLDYRSALRQVAKRVVPDFADWCSVELVNEDTKELDMIALVHKDAKLLKIAKQATAMRKERVKHEPVDDPAIDRGEPVYIPKISEELIRQLVTDDKEADMLLRLGLRSSISVPIFVDERPVGKMTFVSAEQKHEFDDNDYATALELGTRASMAVSNAHLYQSAQQEIVARVRLEEELRKINDELDRRVKERTEQLELTNSSLQRSNQELQDFAYVASHDLQEPLRKIQAFGNLLVDEYGEALGEGGDYLSRMQNAASRMSTLIEDLLAFSRVTTMAKPFVSVNLDVIVHEVLGDLETRIDSTKGIIEVDALPTVPGDPTQMRQLLQNILSNALKFHKPEEAPKIRIVSNPLVDSKDRIKAYEITITDNGIGFDEKYLDRIFAVFQRLHGRDEYAGTGIGLAVCRKIVERHGGTITASSKPGSGSTFIITLPARQKKGVLYS